MSTVPIAILSGAAVAALITGIVNLVLWKWNRRAKLEDDKTDRSDELDDIKNSLNRIFQSLDQLSDQQDNLYKRVTESEDLSKHLFRILYSAHIREIADKALKNGEISLRDKQTLHELHAAYHDDCNGNGFFKELIEDCDDLDVIP